MGTRRVWTAIVPPQLSYGVLQAVQLRYGEVIELQGRSQWPRGLRRRSEAAGHLRLWVRIPPGAWMSVCFECCVLSGRGLCYELITRPEKSCRLWCVVVCDLETSWMRRLWPNKGCRPKNNNWTSGREMSSIIPLSSGKLSSNCCDYCHHTPTHIAGAGLRA